jgi:hypothetical protein
VTRIPDNLECERDACARVSANSVASVHRQSDRTSHRAGKRRSPLRANISETVLVLLINEQGEKEKGRDEREFS